MSQQANIIAFQQVTGASTSQARRFLEISDNNLDNAVILYFESGEQPEPERVPQKGPPNTLPNIPQQQPAQQAPPQKEEKRGFFGVKKEVKEPQVQPQQPTQKPQPQQPKAQQEQSNFQTFKPINNAGEQIFNDGGVKEGGSGTALIRPKGDFNVKIDVYTNGFVLNKKFFSFEDQQNQKYMQELMTSKSIPEAIFSVFPPNERPTKNQQIKADVDQHQTDYNEVVEEQKAQQYTFNANEKGRNLGGTVKAITSSNTASTSVNTNFTMPKTDEKNCVQVRVKADQAFTIKCSKTNTLNELAAAIKNNGGQVDPAKCIFRLQTGQEFDMKMTVEKAGIAQKCVLAIHK
ncbi:Conserved_hypothetical protein [Hexamita inflata]|uniref:SEP domain-containing protein n=1 Tax=Hexamita inflata TaxID=28002 RepID=A0AA86P3V4_9EUKA|nr:Conserved hypothetical protein [Hexamita inflata]